MYDTHPYFIKFALSADNSAGITPAQDGSPKAQTNQVGTPQQTSQTGATKTPTTTQPATPSGAAQPATQPAAQPPAVQTETKPTNVQAPAQTQEQGFLSRIMQFLSSPEFKRLIPYIALGGFLGGGAGGLVGNFNMKNILGGLLLGSVLGGGFGYLYGNRNTKKPESSSDNTSPPAMSINTPTEQSSEAAQPAEQQPGPSNATEMPSMEKPTNKRKVFVW